MQLKATPKNGASTRAPKSSIAAGSAAPSSVKSASPPKLKSAANTKFAPKNAASTRSAKTPASATADDGGTQSDSANVATPRATATAKNASPSVASTRAKKWKARIDIAWTQRADALAQQQPQGRAAIAKSAKRICEYSLRRAIFQNDALREIVEKSAKIAVDITFVSDEEIAELNADYRGKPRPTDVLSFAQSESAGEHDAFFAPPDAPLMLGDLIVSLETALRQAAEQRHDLESEIAFLVAHGTLHLMGYDHGKSGARKTMFALQDEIVEELRVLA